MSKGFLIAFEGADGVGKATQSLRLSEEIKRNSRNVVLYSFPRYETTVGKAIKRHLVGETTLVEGSSVVGWSRAPDDALAFQSLMLADKCDAAGEIEEHLMDGAIVVCDRWTASALAYGATDDLDLEWLWRIHEMLPKANLTFLLRVPQDVAVARRPVLRDRYEKDPKKQLAVFANYARLAKDPSWVTVDGSGTEDEVEATIRAKVRDKLGTLP